MPEEHLAYADKDGNLFNSERKLFQRKNKGADYRLIINYEKFMNGNENDRELLILNNVFKAIKDLDRKAKGNFDGKALMQDILEIFNVSQNEVENV